MVDRHFDRALKKFVLNARSSRDTFPVACRPDIFIFHQPYARPGSSSSGIIGSTDRICAAHTQFEATANDIVAMENQARGRSPSGPQRQQMMHAASYPLQTAMPPTGLGWWID